MVEIWWIWLKTDFTMGDFKFWIIHGLHLHRGRCKCRCRYFLINAKEISTHTPTLHLTYTGVSVIENLKSPNLQEIHYMITRFSFSCKLNHMTLFFREVATMTSSQNCPLEIIDETCIILNSGNDAEFVHLNSNADKVAQIHATLSEREEKIKKIIEVESQLNRNKAN